MREPSAADPSAYELCWENDARITSWQGRTVYFGPKRRWCLSTDEAGAQTDVFVGGRRSLTWRADTERETLTCPNERTVRSHWSACERRLARRADDQCVPGTCLCLPKSCAADAAEAAVNCFRPSGRCNTRRATDADPPFFDREVCWENGARLVRPDPATSEFYAADGSQCLVIQGTTAFPVYRAGDVQWRGRDRYGTEMVCPDGSKLDSDVYQSCLEPQVDITACPPGPCPFPE